MEVITMDSKVYKDLVGKIQRIADFVAKAQVMPKEEMRCGWIVIRWRMP